MSQFPYKIKFPPMAIDGVLSMALQMVLGVPSAQYRFDKDGSTVEFTPDQLKAVIRELNSYKRFAQEDPTSYKEMMPEIEGALETIRKAVMESKNIAQASKYNDLIKKCDYFYNLAVRQ